jgi:hypothetical protein
LGYPARHQSHAVAVFCVDGPFEFQAPRNGAVTVVPASIDYPTWAIRQSDQPDRSGSICRRQDERGKIL